MMWYTRTEAFNRQVSKTCNGEVQICVEG